MSGIEQPIIGQANIAQAFGVTRQTINKHRKMLMEYGVIWPIKRGRPPKKVYAAFPSAISYYCSYQAKQGKGVLDEPDKPVKRKEKTTRRWRANGHRVGANRRDVGG